MLYCARPVGCGFLSRARVPAPIPNIIPITIPHQMPSSHGPPLPTSRIASHPNRAPYIKLDISNVYHIIPPFLAPFLPSSLLPYLLHLIFFSFPTTPIPDPPNHATIPNTSIQGLPNLPLLPRKIEPKPKK